jgi:hypothetical protein
MITHLYGIAPPTPRILFVLSHTTNPIFLFLNHCPQGPQHLARDAGSRPEGNLRLPVAKFHPSRPRKYFVARARRPSVLSVIKCLEDGSSPSQNTIGGRQTRRLPDSTRPSGTPRGTFLSALAKDDAAINFNLERMSRSEECSGVPW